MSNSQETKILFTGFGGQGILFAGKFLAYTGLLQNREVTWLPSYGPEMRGGTAYCGVILSGRAIGSPIVSEPDILVCMNGPSFDKFENSLVAGGLLVLDSSLIDRKTAREDVKPFYLPATQTAGELGLRNAANLILTGKIVREQNLCPREMMPEVLKKITSERKKDLFETSLRALEYGYESV